MRCTTLVRPANRSSQPVTPVKHFKLYLDQLCALAQRYESWSMAIPSTNQPRPTSPESQHSRSKPASQESQHSGSQSQAVQRTLTSFALRTSSGAMNSGVPPGSVGVYTKEDSPKSMSLIAELSDLSGLCVRMEGSNTQVARRSKHATLTAHRPPQRSRPAHWLWVRRAGTKNKGVPPLGGLLPTLQCACWLPWAHTQGCQDGQPGSLHAAEMGGAAPGSRAHLSTIRTFSGFRSRCTMPRPCRCASAWANVAEEELRVVVCRVRAQGLGAPRGKAVSTSPNKDLGGSGKAEHPTSPAAAGQ